MSFGDSIVSAFRKYAEFRGRARRSEYWWFWLFTVLVGFAAGMMDGLLGLADETGNGPIGGIVTLALLLPSLAVGARRLHDTGRSAWWLLIALVPLAGLIVLLIFFVKDSAPGANEHGPNPKEPAGFYGQVATSGYGAAPAYGEQPTYGQQPGYEQQPTYGQPAQPDPRFGTPPAYGSPPEMGPDAR